MKSSLLLPLGLAGLAAAHFELLYPKSIGFVDDDEGKAPCGGFTPDFSKDVVDFHVGGEALAMLLVHPQSNWLFRVTADQTAQTGWEQIFPIVMQSGLGNFCEPKVTVPESYVGKKGVVSVVSSAVDGLLYQVRLFSRLGSSAGPSTIANASPVRRRQLRQGQRRPPVRVQKRHRQGLLRRRPQAVGPRGQGRRQLALCLAVLLLHRHADDLGRAQVDEHGRRGGAAGLAPHGAGLEQRRDGAEHGGAGGCVSDLSGDGRHGTRVGLGLLGREDMGICTVCGRDVERNECKRCVSS